MSLFAGLVMLATTIPYLVGCLSQGSDWQFGGFLFGVDDGYSYLAKMRLGARGDWLFTLRYTAEPHEGALLFLPYLLLGKLTALVVDSRDPRLTPALAVTFHLARIAFGFLLILVSYRFTAVFVRGSASRMLALVFITLGGGLGWLLSIAGRGNWLGSLPVDFYVPEGYSFLILFGLPHLVLSRAAMLAGFLLLFKALYTPGNPACWARWSALAGACWVVMGLCVPFYIAVLYVILAAWGLATWARCRRFPWTFAWRGGIAALVVLPVLVYTSIVFASSDVFGQWSGQNRLPSPHPAHYVLGYAALGVPAVAALRWAWRRGAIQSPYLLLAAWVAIVPALVYLPINVQRRLAEGVIVPLSILAVAGLRLVVARRQWYTARAALLILVLPTSLLLWLGGTFSALTPKRPIFRPQAELVTMDRLNAVAAPDSVVLCSKETGNVLPARTNLIAYVGHGPETLNSSDKERMVTHFFSGEIAPEDRAALLSHVQIVFAGPLESAHASPTWMAGLIPLPLLEAHPDYAVYEVPRD